MKRLRLLLAPAFFAAMSLPAAAEKLSLEEISAYLNGLRTAETSFTQFNDDGSRSTGQFYMKRPGRMRFEYDPPVDALVMAGGNAVAIFDGKSNQPPETYPLKRTPLWLILAPTVDLGQANMVVGHEYDGTLTTVLAQDPENPDQGRIELQFSDNPVMLRQWVVEDASGSRTRVVLDALKTGHALGSSLFSINLERSKPERN